MFGLFFPPEWSTALELKAGNIQDHVPERVDKVRGSLCKFGQGPGRGPWQGVGETGPQAATFRGLTCIEHDHFIFHHHLHEVPACVIFAISIRSLCFLDPVSLMAVGNNCFAASHDGTTDVAVNRARDLHPLQERKGSVQGRARTFSCVTEFVLAE